MTYFLAKKFIAKSNDEVSDEKLSLHKNAFKKELKKYLPSLKNEETGFIEFSQLSQDGLWIEAYLQDTNQLSLKLSTSNKKITRYLENDKFLQLIECVEFEKSLIRKSSYDEMNFQKRVLLREDITKVERDRRFALNEISRGVLDLNIDSLSPSNIQIPRNFSVGGLIKISAYVSMLTAKIAALEKIREIDGEDKVGYLFEVKRKMKLKRNFHVKNKYLIDGDSLRRAMDENRRINMKVNVIYEGITGDIDFLELMEIL